MGHSYVPIVLEHTSYVPIVLKHTSYVPIVLKHTSYVPIVLKHTSYVKIELRNALADNLDFLKTEMQSVKNELINNDGYPL